MTHLTVHCPGCGATIRVDADKLIDSVSDRIAKELGARGGLATKAKHGKAHYQRLAENMNRKKREKRQAQSRNDE